MQRKEIVCQSIIIFAAELIQAGAEGWVMDENNLPSDYQRMNLYTAGLIKVEPHDAAAAALFTAPDKVKAKVGRPPKSVNSAN